MTFYPISYPFLEAEKLPRIPRPPQAACQAREDTVRQLLGLNRTRRPSTTTNLAFRARRIVQVTAGIGVLSAREADVAIGRYVSASKQ